MASTTSTTSTGSAAEVFAAINGSGTGKAASKSVTADMEDRFLTLLMTQIKNQDPLNPLDNAAVTTQMSQINTVTGIEKLNATLATLLSSYHDSEAMQAAALIGKNVLVSGSTLSLNGGAAYGGVNLGGPADNVTVTILDAAGKVVQSQNLGARPAGSFSFAWDGKTDAGGSAAPGNYRFTVSAVRGTEKLVADTLQIGTVSALVRGTDGVQLDLAGLGRVAFDKVQQIL